MDFGIFHRATHLENPTLAFQKTIATLCPTPSQTITGATMALWQVLDTFSMCQCDPPRFGLVLL